MQSSSIQSPRRYESLRGAVSKGNCTISAAALDRAFARIEEQRLLAEGKLNADLRLYWAADFHPSGGQRPSDLIPWFLNYATTLHESIIANLLPLLRGEDEYRYVLETSKEWIIRQILPVHPTPDGQLKRPVIGLRETISEFKDRIGGDTERYSSEFIQAEGDWESAVEEAVVYSIRTGTESVDFLVWDDRPFIWTLRAESNWHRLWDDLDLALDENIPVLMARWWRVVGAELDSKDHPSDSGHDREIPEVTHRGSGALLPEDRESSPGDRDNRTRINDFMDRILRETGTKIRKKDIWKVAGYDDATQFERFQRNEKATRMSIQKFNSTLKMKSAEFLKRLGSSDHSA